MRTIKVKGWENEIKRVQLVSSRRDIRERIIKFKGYSRNPDFVYTISLSETENDKFERGLMARAKGGVIRVQK